ncbi:MAG: hypothetical protein V3S25_11555 [Nitrospirales bacterium]
MSLLDNINFAEIENEIADMIEDAMDEVTDAAQADMHKFGKRIAVNLVRAIRSDDPRVLRALKGQARMLAEMNRIRLNREAKALLSRILDVAARVGKVLLTAAVAAV